MMMIMALTVMVIFHDGDILHTPYSTGKILSIILQTLSNLRVR